MSATTRMLEVSGDPNLALVYLLQLDERPLARVETVDSIDPRFARSEKSVIILSTQFGCPVGCKMCDAGASYGGNLSAKQMLDQVRWVLERRPEARSSAKLKVHFARMGEPSLNDAVLEALTGLVELVPGTNLLPCIASVAPRGRFAFFEQLIALKNELYPRRFQLQFSLNSTDEATRRSLMPVAQIELAGIAELGRRFYQPGGRKVVLNFALAEGVPLDDQVLADNFAPEHFIVKLTPINPTAAASAAGLASVLSPVAPGAAHATVERLRQRGFETIVSIGAPEEIAIGSNCGQLVHAYTLAESAATNGAGQLSLP